ncbi:MAG TPA: glycosyltransferase, partial [Chthoniobacterales bacterium]
LRIYIDPAYHTASDYRDVRRFSAGVHATNFTSEPSPGLYRKLRRMAQTIIRKHRWPASPMSDLSRLLVKNGTDVLFAGPEFKEGSNVPQICWIPDFQHVYRPDFFSAAERARRDELFERIMAGAAGVIVSNQCSYADAVRIYPDSRRKLAILPFTMYLGRQWRKGDPERVILKYDLPKKFLLLPGQFWKHKNHATAFRAIQLLPERGLDDVVLICTGFPHDPRFPGYAAELHEFVVTHRLEKAIRILGLLPRHEQVQLMRAAAAIVQPSFFEGWSAVLEECRSLGKQIFASDIPMHREQQTSSVHLFDPMSAAALVDVLSRTWSQLKPGPQPDLEAAAEAEYHSRIQEFARQFVTLCRGVVGASR